MTAQKVKEMLDNDEQVYFQNTEFNVFGKNGNYAMNVVEVINGLLCPENIKLSIEGDKIKDKKTGDLFNPDDFFSDPKFLCVITNKGKKEKHYIFDEELYNKNIGRITAAGMKVEKKEIGNDWCKHYALSKFPHLQAQGFGMVLC